MLGRQEQGWGREGHRTCVEGDGSALLAALGVLTAPQDGHPGGCPASSCGRALGAKQTILGGAPFWVSTLGQGLSGPPFSRGKLSFVSPRPWEAPAPLCVSPDTHLRCYREQRRLYFPRRRRRQQKAVYASETLGRAPSVRPDGSGKLCSGGLPLPQACPALLPCPW